MPLKRDVSLMASEQEGSPPVPWPAAIGRKEPTLSPGPEYPDMDLPSLPNFFGTDFYPREFVDLLEKSIQLIIHEHTSGSLMLVSISNLAMIINAYGHDTSEIVMHDLIKMIKGILT